MRVLLAVFVTILIFLGNPSFSQNCTSQRYQRQVFNNVTVTHGVKFGRATPYGLFASDQDLKMDIYEPTGDTVTKRPVILYQFGGAFLIGTRDQPNIPDYANYFTKLGYVVISIDYRIGFNLTDEGSAWRAMYRAVQDQRAALRFMSQRAGQYRIDTNSYFITGSSAGCMTGFNTLYMTQNMWPSDIHGTFLEPDDLGGLNNSGNNDYNHQNPHIRGQINHWGSIHDTSQITAANAVPLLSIHGTIDVLVPYYNGNPFGYPLFPYQYGSYRIEARMRHLGAFNTLVPLDNYGHEPELLQTEVNDTMYNEGRIFLWHLLKPVTSPISGPSLACMGSAVTYSVTNNNGSRYCWQLTGNGTIVQNNGSSISVVWNDPGPVSVQVTEINYMDAQADPVSMPSVIIPHSVASYSATINQLQVAITNTSINSTNYQWDFGDGTTSSDLSPTVTYQADGSYTITLIASNQSCSDTFRTTVDVHSCPDAQFNSQANLLTASFIDASSHATNYYWNFGNGDTSTLQNPTESYTTEGTYIVMLIAGNPYCQDTFSTSVTVHSCPIPYFGNNINELTVEFFDSSQHVTNYYWDFGNGDTSNTANPVETYTADGIYNITMVATNPYCTDTVRSTVEVHSCPRAVFSYAANKLDVSFSDSSSHATNYFWDFGNGDTSTSQFPTVHYASGGIYNIMMVASNPYCQDTAYEQITIDSCPVAHFTSLVLQSNCQLVADTTNTTMYNWDFGDGDSIGVNTSTFSHTYAQNGTYTVVLKVTNQLGCESTDSINVTVQVETVAINTVVSSNTSINCNGVTGCAISISSSDKYQLEVFDAVGRSLYKSSVTGNYFLPTEGYAQGMYFVRLSNNGNTFVQKFVKR